MKEFKPENVSESARKIVQKASDHAKTFKHSEFNVLHVLSAIIFDDKAKHFIKGAGGNLHLISKDVKENLLKLPRHKGKVDPSPTLEISQLLNIAANKSVASITIGHLILAMKEVEATKDILSGVDEKRVIVSRDYGEELSNYSRDLTKLAKQGRLDPVIGRDTEVRRAIQTLSRRNKNNPVIIGESGVGKTSVVLAIAQRIADNDVPDSLRGISILQLDLASLVAGAQYRGQFEERLKGVITAASDARDVILFIDDLHNLMGTGSSESGQDAASILKPALANGEVRCIGATTTDAYKKHIEKDPQLERRFQAVRINEPTVEDSISILRGLREKFTSHHGLRIQDSALVAAAKLSARYIQNRFLPDKAIDLIDEACAELKMEIESVPSVIDERERKIKRLIMERASLDDNRKDKARKSKINDEIAKLEVEASTMRAQWENERVIFKNVKKTSEVLEKTKNSAKNAEKEGNLELASKILFGDVPELESRLKELSDEMKKAQASGAFLRDSVTEEDIAKVIASWTGIPAEKMLQQKTQKELMKMEDRLHERVVGQHPAIVAVSDAIRQSRAGLTDPKAPVGTFLFLGPTGVGKCLAPDTEVLCYNGDIIKAKDIKENMLLMGPDSEPRKVLSTTTGHGPMYKITPTKGDSWICNDVHVLTLKRSDTGEIKDIPLNEYLELSNNQKNLLKQFSVGANFAAQEPLPVDPYFIGVWVGDGSKSETTIKDFSNPIIKDLRISKDDKEIVDEIYSIAKKWGCNVRPDNSSSCTTWRLTTDMGQPHPLLNEMRNLFKDDSVSMKILTASREERLEFLAGCLDTDGYLFNNCFEIVQKRKKFADAISFVARSLGFKVTTSEKFVDDKKYFRMFISGETSLIPTRIERKQASKRRQIKNACHTGFKVEKIEDGQYCGFTLNGDGRFLLGDFTVTHNTECAKALAEFLFDDDQAIVRVDMSEYMEKHAVSRLVGSPPGYVGYDEGGQLTEAVRHRPYCLVLLDEVEKAHPDVWNIMLQVFDEGRLTDTQGRTVDFTNTIILMTSNIGSDLYYQDHDDQTLAVLRDKLLQSKFRPEFLNRIDETIYFHPLYKEHMINILDIQLQSVQKRLKEKELSLTLSKEAREWLAENGYDPKFGARPLKRLIKKEILKPLSDHMLTTEIKPGSEIKMALEGEKLKVVTTTKSKR